ncbi:high-affinity iron permease [Physocladia obscura]|uniref:High-affinity iron permease n=1 Tax=Physocladia obscura TaxID=109957 RepID=A0AAD5T6F7_9FUNG|nr:high-affinity iron permease [Physocladia obscura]
MRRRLTTVIWIGTGVGLLASMAVGGAFLGVWFTYANNLWNQTESLWEAIFSLIACVLLTAMAFAFLKSDELTAKWHRKLHKSLADQGISGTDTLVQQQDFAVSDTEIVEIVALTTPMLADENINPKKEIANIDEKSENEIRTDRRAIQVFFWIPFVTVLREGLEGIVFLGGVRGWQFFNAVLGWSNNATYASVTCYAVYWCFISGVLVAMKLLDRRRRRLGKEKVGFKKMVKSLFIKAK